MKISEEFHVLLSDVIFFRAGKAISNAVFDTVFGILETGTNVFRTAQSKKAVPAKTTKARRSVKVEFYSF